jgi:hypothetical protein
MNYVSLAFKVAPFVFIAALLMLVAIMRGDNIKEHAAAVTAKANADQLQQVNQANAETIKKLSDAAASNEQIAKNLSASLARNSKVADEARQKLKGAYNANPAANAWASVPVPDSVRDALNQPPSADSLPPS